MLCRFATMEGVLALIRLYQKFTFSLNEAKHGGRPLEQQSLITLMPKVSLALGCGQASRTDCASRATPLTGGFYIIKCLGYRAAPSCFRNACHCSLGMVIVSVCRTLTSWGEISQQNVLAEHAADGHSGIITESSNSSHALASISCISAGAQLSYPASNSTHLIRYHGVQAGHSVVVMKDSQKLCKHKHHATDCL